ASVVTCCHSTAPEADRLALHDALPTYIRLRRQRLHAGTPAVEAGGTAIPGEAHVVEHDRHLGEGCRHLGSLLQVPVRHAQIPGQDRKSTRLNSSHVKISYAVFCLKKKT